MPLLEKNGEFQNERVVTRIAGEAEIVEADLVDYMDVSPKQIVSSTYFTNPFFRA